MASIVRWDPIRDYAGLQHGVDRLFRDVGLWRTPLSTVSETGAIVPTIDVFTRGEDLVMRAELPGISADDVDISVTDGVLTVSAERHEETRVDEQDYLVRESRWGTMRRSMRLPEGADVSKIHATYSDGILEITMPSAAPSETRTHKIAIETPVSGSKELTEHH